MRNLNPGFTSEVDSITRDQWYQILDIFSDANIYQTWDYAAIKSGEKKLSHLLLKKEGKVVAAAQARIIKLPFINIGIAYIYWGPIWRKRGKQPENEIFEQVIRALRNEYTIQRRLALRIRPHLFDDQSEIFIPILKQEGFSFITAEGTQRTLLINLDYSIEDLRKGLNPKWRGHLNKSERNNLTLLEGFDDNLFKRYIAIHKKMISRKKFVAGSDVNEFRLMQHNLPEGYKTKVWLALSDDSPIAGVVTSFVGDMGIYLYGATTSDGLKKQGSYFLQWKIVNWLKENGAKWYNLHGINPIDNPGVYTFKAGLCGKNGKDVHFLGVYDSCQSVGSHIVTKLLGLKSIFRKRNIFGKNQPAN